MAVGPDLGLIPPSGDRANDGFTENHRSGATDRLADCGSCMTWLYRPYRVIRPLRYRTLILEEAVRCRSRLFNGAVDFRVFSAATNHLAFCRVSTSRS